MRTAIEVNRLKLENAIEIVEKDGPLSNRSTFLKIVCNLYNADSPVIEITPAIVGLRIDKWSMSVKTKCEPKMNVAASKQSMVLEPLDKRISESVGSVRSLISKIERRPKTEDSFEDEIDDFEVLEEVLDPRRTMFQYGGGGQVAAPAGPCPFTPKGYKKGWPDGPASDEVIQNWANDVYNSGGGKYAVRAVVYWSRHFWDITGPERKRVKSLIIETLQPLRNSKFVNQAVLADK